MSTAGDDINSALRLIGQLAEGETPSSETTTDALSALNSMIDSWSAERLSVYSTQDQTVTWPAGSSNESLGPSGSLGTPGTLHRPVILDDSTYFRDPT